MEPEKRIPKISIGMPVYNAEQYLRQALDAIVCQTCSDFELVISDNCSTDSTWSICMEYAKRDSRLVLHKQNENIGAIGNFGFVLDQSRADLFMWAAYDDLRTPNMLDELANILDRHPEANLGVCRTVRVDSDGAELEEQCFPDAERSSRLRRMSRLAAAAVRSGWFYGMFRTEAIKQASRLWLKSSQTWGADYLMLLSFVFNDSVVGTNEATFFQRLTGKSASQYAPSRISENARFMSHMLAGTWSLLRHCDPAVKRDIGSWGLARIFAQCAACNSKLALSRTSAGPLLLAVSRKLKKNGVRST